MDRRGVASAAPGIFFARGSSRCTISCFCLCQAATCCHKARPVSFARSSRARAWPALCAALRLMVASCRCIRRRCRSTEVSQAAPSSTRQAAWGQIVGEQGSNAASTPGTPWRALRRSRCWLRTVPRRLSRRSTSPQRRGGASYVSGCDNK